MFGDAGHGTIMLAFSLWMIIAEKSLEKKREISEIFSIFFGGRYIIFLMSLFSIYTGKWFKTLSLLKKVLFKSFLSTYVYQIEVLKSFKAFISKASFVDERRELECTV